MREKMPKHTERVALMLSKPAQKSPHRIYNTWTMNITASFTTKKRKISLNIVYCYSPTNKTDELIKEECYLQLQSVIDETFSARDVNILMGDLNAKVGSDNTGFEEARGCHGLGHMNENGELFVNSGVLQTVWSGVELSSHIREYIKLHGFLQTTILIDQKCISKKFKQALHDDRAMRGADAASDHTRKQ